MKVIQKYSISFLFLLFYTIDVKSQNCQINSVLTACIDDIINFSVTSTKIPITYQWDFGNGNTSTQPKPGISYTTHGSYTVTLQLSFADGTFCNTTKSLVIHPKPISDFSINGGSNTFCFSKSLVCITDISKPGATGNPIVQRVFLWDNGAGDNTSNPTANRVLCHSYNQDGVYNLLMETTDDKGCQAKSTKQITILADFDVKMQQNIRTNPTTCKLEICLTNTTKPKDTLSVSEFEWNFGDGTKKTNSWPNYDTICHTYQSNGLYTAYLKVKHKNVCKDSVSTQVNVSNPDIKFNLQGTKVICLGDSVTFRNNATNNSPIYSWFFRDSATGIEDLLPDKTNPISFTPQKPGKYFLKLNILVGGCARSVVDTFIVKGPAAEIIARNNKQCLPMDTTYFCDVSNYYRAYNVVKLWNFNHGAQCTTDTKKGINVNSNCKFSVDDNPKHLYSHNNPSDKYTCFYPTLYLIDTVTKCESSNSSQIFLGMPPLDNLTVTDKAKKYCTEIGAIDQDRVVSFTINGLSCNQGWDLFLNFDSAAGINNFKQVLAIPPPIHLYRGTANAMGNVTIGFMVSNGKTTRYSSCTDTLQAQGNVCTDTVWYHHKLNVAQAPNPYVSFVNTKTCAPYNFTLQPDDSIQYGVKKVVWDWGDGNADSIELLPTDSIIPKRFHTYLKNGAYTPSLTMYNGRNCKEVQSLNLGLGYANYVLYDSLVCAGDSVTLEDVLFYYDKADTLWRDTVRFAKDKERLWWDFDDGKGFVYKPPRKRVVFATDKIYNVRMASKDSTGCADTFAFKIRAVRADANIRSMEDTFYCNDNIIRFYDSSYGSPDIPGDIATKWSWSFGDGKNPGLLKDPFHFYSSFGKKNVQLIVKSKAGCTDTAYKEITIVGPVPYFEIATDSIGCDPLKVVFNNTSSRVKQWLWYMGDVGNNIISTNNDSDITFVYTPAGKYNIRLYGADSIFNPNTGNTYFCSATYPDSPLVKQVIVIPNHPVGFVIPDTVCQDNPFLVRSTAATRYDWFRWWMGNGDSVFTGQKQFTYSYPQPGNFRIDFKPTYTPTNLERLCIDDTFKNITVVPIKADFEINTPAIAPLFYFTNTSTNSTRYEWDFGHPESGNANFSKDKNTWHNYKLKLGTFTICLRAYNNLGCVDTVCKQVVNNYIPRLKIPNAFSPQGIDTTNARFDIDIHFPLLYNLSIYNRWGEKVFESQEDGNGNTDVLNWDGIHYKTGILCPAGVYFVVFDYEILGTDEKNQYKGTLTLFREE